MKKIIFILILSGIFIGISADPVPTSKKKGHIFSDLKDEYKLVSYFFTSNQKKYYKSLDENRKKRYLEAFWAAQDTNPTTEKNEFLEEIKIRIAYCNSHFSHFHPGWTTDRGRIFLKHGEPYEILNETTSMNTKYARKDYQIWKYRITEYLTYIFIDIQQHGDYRLIFSDGDDSEGSWADWHMYLGEDFDEGKLY
jgi:GWxTD domain-containing protein